MTMLIKFRNVFIIVFALVLISSLGFAEGEVLLTGENYVRVTHKLVSEAKESVDVYMYFIIAKEDEVNNPINVLVSDLINAVERDVGVSVFLENRKLSENKDVYLRLIETGVMAGFDTPDKLLHAKVVVVDDRYCIIGSTNWTRAAIMDNWEVSVLIDSVELARDVKEYFSTLEIVEKPVLAEGEEEGVSVPYSFLLNPRMGSQMFKDHASKAFDLYLVLLRKSQEAGSRTIDFSYRDIALALGYKEFNRKVSRGKNEKEYYHLKIRKPFKALKSNYYLVKYDTLRDRKVTLVPVESAESFILPYGYWDYNYSTSLSFRAKYMYLISLLETDKNKDYPFWFRSNKSFASIYNISTNPVSLGFLELEREDIIEITRSTFKDSKYEDRHANIYKIKALVSPEEFNVQIDMLNEKYGKEITGQAIYLSSRINHPKDIKKIEGFINLVQEYGYMEVLEAVETTTRYKKGTGLYSMETVYSLLDTPCMAGDREN